MYFGALILYHIWTAHDAKVFFNIHGVNAKMGQNGPVTLGGIKQRKWKLQTDALQTFTQTLRLECSEKEHLAGNLQNTAIIRKKNCYVSSHKS